MSPHPILDRLEIAVRCGDRRASSRAAGEVIALMSSYVESDAFTPFRLIADRLYNGTPIDLAIVAELRAAVLAFEIDQRNRSTTTASTTPVSHPSTNHRA